VILALYKYWAYNYQFLETLVPKDDNLVSSTTVSFELNVEFVGFAGCVNGSMDADADGYVDHDVVIVDSGLEVRRALCRFLRLSGL
jgi:hypothetical protein